MSFATPQRQVHVRRALRAQSQTPACVGEGGGGGGDACV